MQFTDNVILWGQLAAALSAIGGVVYVIVKYAVVRPIQNYIDKATYQIQPFSNGGNSLPDAIRAIKKIDQKLEKLYKRVDALEDTLSPKS